MHFSMPNSIPIYWLYILTGFFQDIQFFCVFGQKFEVIRVHQVVDFFPAIYWVFN